MGVVDRLNALDERAGLGTPANASGWARAVRLWWLGPAVAGIAIAGLSALAALTGVTMGVWMALPMLPAVFWGGFFYDERLRALGRRPGLGRVPPGWPGDGA